VGGNINKEGEKVATKERLACSQEISKGKKLAKRINRDNSIGLRRGGFCIWVRMEKWIRTLAQKFGE